MGAIAYYYNNVLNDKKYKWSRISSGSGSFLLLCFVLVNGIEGSMDTKMYSILQYISLVG